MGQPIRRRVRGTGCSSHSAATICPGRLVGVVEAALAVRPGSGGRPRGAPWPGEGPGAVAETLDAPESTWAQAAWVEVSPRARAREVEPGAADCFDFPGRCPGSMSCMHALARPSSSGRRSSVPAPRGGGGWPTESTSGSRWLFRTEFWQRRNVDSRGLLIVPSQFMSREEAGPHRIIRRREGRQPTHRERKSSAPPMLSRWGSEKARSPTGRCLCVNRSTE